MKLAVFDIDGTLARTRLIDETCYARAFMREFGFDGIEGSTAAYQHSTDSGIAIEIFHARLGRDPEADELARVHFNY